MKEGERKRGKKKGAREGRRKEGREGEGQKTGVREGGRGKRKGWLSCICLISQGRFTMLCPESLALHEFCNAEF